MTTTRPVASVRITSRLPGGFIDCIEATIDGRVVTGALGGLWEPGRRVAGDVFDAPVTDAEAQAVWDALDLMEMNSRPL